MVMFFFLFFLLGVGGGGGGKKGEILVFGQMVNRHLYPVPLLFSRLPYKEVQLATAVVIGERNYFGLLFAICKLLGGKQGVLLEMWERRIMTFTVKPLLLYCYCF